MLDRTNICLGDGDVRTKYWPKHGADRNALIARPLRLSFYRQQQSICMPRPHTIIAGSAGQFTDGELFDGVIETIAIQEIALPFASSHIHVKLRRSENNARAYILF